MDTLILVPSGIRFGYWVKTKDARYLVDSMTSYVDVPNHVRSISIRLNWFTPSICNESVRWVVEVHETGREPQIKCVTDDNHGAYRLCVTDALSFDLTGAANDWDMSEVDPDILAAIRNQFYLCVQRGGGYPDDTLADAAYLHGAMLSYS